MSCLLLVLQYEILTYAIVTWIYYNTLVYFYCKTPK